MGMMQEAAETKRNYQREYRRRHRGKINARQREWAANHPEKIMEYRKRYQDSLSGKKSIRAPWVVYGIDKERLRGLQEIVRSGQYEEIVLDAAHKANELAAAHIILSIMGNLSYESLEARYASGKIEKVPLGRSDFYGVRRLFFRYLNILLKDLQEKERKGEER